MITASRHSPASREKRRMTPPSRGTGQSRAGPSTQSARQRSPPVQADADTTCTKSIAALGVRSPQSAAWPVRLVVRVMARAKRSDATRAARDDTGARRNGTVMAPLLDPEREATFRPVAVARDHAPEDLVTAWRQRGHAHLEQRAVLGVDARIPA